MQDMTKFAENFNKNQKCLRYYLRDDKGNKIALLIAFKDKDGVIRLGWSKCKVRSNEGNVDRFDKHMALFVAVGRARKYQPEKVFVDREEKVQEDETSAVFHVVLEVPHCIKKSAPEFIKRVEKYFKTELHVTV